MRHVLSNQKILGLRNQPGNWNNTPFKKVINIFVPEKHFFSMIFLSVISNRLLSLKLYAQGPAHNDNEWELSAFASQKRLEKSCLNYAINSRSFYRWTMRMLSIDHDESAIITSPKNFIMMGHNRTLFMIERSKWMGLFLCSN